MSDQVEVTDIAEVHETHINNFKKNIPVKNQVSFFLNVLYNVYHFGYLEKKLMYISILSYI